jgi:transcriptional regulator with XRE-family HTH domain
MRLSTNDFGRKLGYIIFKRGIAQNKLAHNLNISESHLSKLLSGDVQPKFETVTKIANYLQVPVCYFHRNPQYTCFVNNGNIDYMPILDHPIKIGKRVVVVYNYENKLNKTFIVTVYAYMDSRVDNIDKLWYGTDPKATIVYYVVSGEMQICLDGDCRTYCERDVFVGNYADHKDKAISLKLFKGFVGKLTFHGDWQEFKAILSKSLHEQGED